MKENENNFNSWDVSELRSVLNNIFKEFSGDQIEIFKKDLPKENDVSFVKINISNWNDADKKLLFKGALAGVYSYYLISGKRSFSLAAYNSIILAIEGNDSIDLYLNGIKWYSPIIKTKLRENGIKFPGLDNNKKNYSSDHSDGLSDYGGWEQDAMMNENN